MPRGKKESHWGFLGKQVTWSDLCFRHIILALVEDELERERTVRLNVRFTSAKSKNWDTWLLALLIS